MFMLYLLFQQMWWYIIYCIFLFLLYVYTFYLKGCAAIHNFLSLNGSFRYKIIFSFYYKNNRFVFLFVLCIYSFTLQTLKIVKNGQSSRILNMLQTRIVFCIFVKQSYHSLEIFLQSHIKNFNVRSFNLSQNDWYWQSWTKQHMISIYRQKYIYLI